MAIYHTNLQYHEDTSQKKSLTAENIAFLEGLQKEMNTQDTCGEADPRYWVIRGTEREFTPDGTDGFILYHNGDEIANDSLEETAEALNNLLKEDGFEFKYGRSKSNFEFVDISKNGEKLWCVSDMADLEDWINANDYDYVLELKYFDNVQKDYPDAIFLTQKAAEEHLKRNSYHYSQDAHTYARTFFRSPELEILYEILQKTDFAELKKNITRK